MSNARIICALLVLTTLGSSCARRADGPEKASARQPPDVQPANADQTAEIVEPSKTGPQPRPSGPHPMQGEWALAMGDASGGTPGLHLTLVVDSGTTEAFYGRVTHFFSGNVGVDPRIFRPFRGIVSDQDHVEIPIEPATPDAPRLHLEGRVRGDTLQLASFMVGADRIAIEQGGAELVRTP